MQNSENTCHHSDKPAADPVPRGLFYAVLAVLWCFPSAGAVWILARGAGDWAPAAGLGDFISRVRFEEWIGGMLLLAQVFFGWLGWRYWRGNRKQS